MFKLDEGVDTGPILSQYQSDYLVQQGEQRSSDPHTRSPASTRIFDNQSGSAERGIGLRMGGPPSRDGEIHPNEMTVGEADRLVRAVTHPYPGAFIRRSDDQVLRIWNGSPVEAPPVGNLQSLTLKDDHYQIEQFTIEQGLDRKASDRNKL